MNFFDSSMLSLTAYPKLIIENIHQKLSTNEIYDLEHKNYLNLTLGDEWFDFINSLKDAKVQQFNDTKSFRENIQIYTYIYYYKTLKYIFTLIPGNIKKIIITFYNYFVWNNNT